jgi:undecaprenyl-diphosphatase
MPMNKKFLLFIVFLFFSFICFAQNWDIDLLKNINLHRERFLDTFFIVVTDFAAPIAYSIPVVIFLFSIIKKKKLLKNKSLYIISSSLLALLITTSIKHIVNRPRPFITYPFLQKMIGASSPSFPSGHTSDAFTFAASLSFAFPKWYVIIPSYVWAITVGYSRMDLGVHYPSDVFASMVIGISSAFICYKLKERIEKRMLKKELNSNNNEVV